ncbi:MAG: hypothetical protein R2877_08865, partial [Bdellovibrionota bacterium]
MLGSGIGVAKVRRIMNRILLVIVILCSFQKSEAWEKTYTFWFNDAINSIVLNYDYQALEDCRKSVYQWHREHGTLSSEKDVNYKRYVKYPPCNNIVEHIIDRLNGLALHGFVQIESKKDYVELFLAFVNGIPYAKDQEAWNKSDYIQTPFETIYFN